MDWLPSEYWDGKWHHVVILHDADGVTLWIDGVRYGEK